MYYLSDAYWFPSVEEADEDGLLAVGGDLAPERLLLAYRSGIFPWYSEGQPLLWWSPNPRMVLFPEEFKLSKSLRKTIEKDKFRISFNQAFPEVISQCSKVPRRDQGGTWITDDMIAAYTHLHFAGHARSVEAWLDDQLVGGLYGIDLQDFKVFCGESMFSLVSDASKVAFYHLVEQLKKDGYQLIDCQMYTPHLESLGAREIDRAEFLKYLA